MQIKQLGIRLKEMEEKFNEINRLDKQDNKAKSNYND